MAESSGFKGSVTNISEVTVSGSTTGFKVAFRVLFSDPDGIVHAITRHEIDPSENLEIREAATKLIETLTRWAVGVHFSSPAQAPAKEERVRGLVESLDDGSAGPVGSVPQG